MVSHGIGRKYWRDGNCDTSISHAKGANKLKKIRVPLKTGECALKAGDLSEMTGTIYCGRDAVLPYVVEMAKNDTLLDAGIDIEGAVIFHTAVSCAGIAPTTTGKPEIEGAIVPLSEKGAKFHLGKGRILPETIAGLKQNGAYFLITPPVAALLTAAMSGCRVALHPEFGMEAFYEITVTDFPAIVAVADGESIFPD